MKETLRKGVLSHIVKHSPVSYPALLDRYKNENVLKEILTSLLEDHLITWFCGSYDATAFGVLADMEA